MSSEIAFQVQAAATAEDPVCAKILFALADGHALPAGELAAYANTATQPTRARLAAMQRAGWLTYIDQGRHRYYRIAAGAAANRALERIAARGNAESGALRPPRSRVDPALRSARSCYKHLAGRLGVALCDAMRATGRVETGGGAARVTPGGLELLETLGIEAAPFREQPRSRVCLVDWSERREHLAGALGNALHKRFMELGWVRAHPGNRAISVTETGVKGFRSAFGIDIRTIR